MSNCCSTTNANKDILNFPKKYSCPINKKSYSLVSKTTIKHHIKSPWNLPEGEQGYYFCSDPNCDVVYFSQDDFIIHSNQLRTEVGIKVKSRQKTLCYCFGIDYTQATNEPELKKFVIDQTRSNACACNIRHPSGKCCLKDFNTIKNNYKITRIQL
ncbi:putative iron-sulfur cluster-binding metallochaperone [sulfur-oxidizing endosymbiont of Gigantopelta aegis]|uniref:putative iron-sulfur cluster-binding metallochaperone n=1 Tax=sulfur-oxidizing endosymbiont of Gigantopelta aegis TaxID=2794934 RepID=UPI002483BBFE|nr:hypothetical protein [sulfur-oxidizing endosymbiont of Gigantopelta aegis]